MTKIKFNVKGVDGGARSVLKPGVYRAKITSCVDAKPSGKDRRLEVTYEITDKENKGYKLYDYINLESEAAAWKLRQFLEAVGIVEGKKETGSFDPDDVVGTALSIRTTVSPATDQYAASAKASTLMPLDADGDEEDLGDDDTEGGDDDDDDGDEEQDYSAMDVDELTTEAEERELDTDEILKGKKNAKTKKAALIAALEEDDESEDDSDDEDEESENVSDDESDDDEDETYSEEELNDLSDSDLVDVAWGYTDEDEDEIEGILDDEEKDTYVTTKKVKGKRKQVVDRDALIARILEAQGEDEDGDDETPDYDSMDLKDLKKLAEERELSSKGSKKVLVARLQKDDEPF